MRRMFGPAVLASVLLASAPAVAGGTIRPDPTVPPGQCPGYATACVTELELIIVVTLADITRYLGLGQGL